MTRTLRFGWVLAFYVCCIVAAYFLVPGPFGVILAAYTIVVWLGGVSFHRLVMEWQHSIDSD